MTHTTHEQSQRLKALGFDKPTRDYYIRAGVIKNNASAHDWNNASAHDWNIHFITSAPTRSEVLQWAREKHGIDAWVHPLVSNNVMVYFYAWFKDFVQNVSGEEYPTHPEAESALVWKIIELIKEKKA